VLVFNPAADQQVNVEMRFFADADAARELKLLHLQGQPAASQTVIVYPQPTALFDWSHPPS